MSGEGQTFWEKSAYHDPTAARGDGDDGDNAAVLADALVLAVDLLKTRRLDEGGVRADDLRDAIVDCNSELVLSDRQWGSLQESLRSNPFVSFNAESSAYTYVVRYDVRSKQEVLEMLYNAWAGRGKAGEGVLTSDATESYPEAEADMRALAASGHACAIRSTATGNPLSLFPRLRRFSVLTQLSGRFSAVKGSYQLAATRDVRREVRRNDAIILVKADECKKLLARLRRAAEGIDSTDPPVGGVDELFECGHGLVVRDEDFRPEDWQVYRVSRWALSLKPDELEEGEEIGAGRADVDAASGGAGGAGGTAGMGGASTSHRAAELEQAAAVAAAAEKRPPDGWADGAELPARANAVVGKSALATGAVFSVASEIDWDPYPKGHRTIRYAHEFGASSLPLERPFEGETGRYCVLRYGFTNDLRAMWRRVVSAHNYSATRRAGDKLVADLKQFGLKSIVKADTGLKAQPHLRDKKAAKRRLKAASSARKSRSSAQLDYLRVSRAPRRRAAYTACSPVRACAGVQRRARRGDRREPLSARDLQTSGLVMQLRRAVTSGAPPTAPHRTRKAPALLVARFPLGPPRATHAQLPPRLDQQGAARS